MRERLKNKEAIKSLTCCTHFITGNHIAHAATFDYLVDVHCSSEAVEVKIGGGSSKVRKEMPHTHLKMQSLTLLQRLVNGLKNCFSNICIRHSTCV